MPDSPYSDNEDFGTFPAVSDPLVPPVRPGDLATAVAFVVVAVPMVVGLIVAVVK